ncbi:uncharacterized protein LOC111545734 [Piliocolobus tephrosceles]|uniref:uncharacterized protein LOC111545734 n=1 Tax=Piliocolobus tephrosceles TaxID=591936 RepID=UPI000C29D0CD|nr:uncharacterized protein LOC111545734 [Piliocolobus tephrosceles]
MPANICFSSELCGVCGLSSSRWHHEICMLLNAELHLPKTHMLKSPCVRNWWVLGLADFKNEAADPRGSNCKILSKKIRGRKQERGRHWIQEIGNLSPYR